MRFNYLRDKKLRLICHSTLEVNKIAIRYITWLRFSTQHHHKLQYICICIDRDQFICVYRNVGRDKVTDLFASSKSKFLSEPIDLNKLFILVKMPLRNFILNRIDIQSLFIYRLGHHREIEISMTISIRIHFSQKSNTLEIIFMFNKSHTLYTHR